MDNKNDNENKNVPDLNNGAVEDLLLLAEYFRNNHQAMFHFILILILSVLGYLGFRFTNVLIDNSANQNIDSVIQLNRQNSLLIGKYDLDILGVNKINQTQASFYSISLYPDGKNSKERIVIFQIDNSLIDTNYYRFTRVPVNLESDKPIFNQHKQNKCSSTDNQTLPEGSFIRSRFKQNYIISCPVFEDSELLGAVYLYWINIKELDFNIKKENEQYKIFTNIKSEQDLIRDYLKEYRNFLF